MIFFTTTYVLIFTIFGLIVHIHATLFYGYDESTDESTSNIPKLSKNLFSSIPNVSNKAISSSSILSTLSTKQRSFTKIKTNLTTLSSSHRSSSLPALKSSTTTPSLPMPIPPYLLISDLVDQFNHYRNIDILSRIKQCDSNMKLSDMCETYSFDNHTYSLVRQLKIKFQSLKDIYESLIDRIIVQKLSTYCPTARWCLGNLTQYNIRFTANILRQRGRSFCSLETCRHRLNIYATSCPSISIENISSPTIALLPTLCTLYTEQQSWRSPQCTSQVVYLLHIIYAFWPQLQTCYNVISAGSGGCTNECLTFDSILHDVQNKCNKSTSFLTRVPALAWYRLINLQETCRHEPVSKKAPFVSSFQTFISSNNLWHRLHQRPVYAVLFLIIVICILTSFGLCLFYMSNNENDSDSRRLDDGYEYTRLHDSTLELSTNSQTSNRPANQSQADTNDNRRLLEHQRLLYMES